jgi:hypothetical protein
MDNTGIAGVFLLSGAAGFGVYCLCCAAHVWQTRRSKLAGRSTAGRCRRLATGLFVLGCVSMAAAAILTLAVDRIGVLHGERVFTLRAPQDRQVREIVEGESIKAGEILARFEEPEREAQIAVLQLRLEELAAERAVLQSEPLEPDREIVRHLQESSTQRRHLETKQNELTMELGRLARERSRDMRAKQDELKRLQVKSDTVQGELAQAQAELSLNESRLKRVIALREKRVAIDEEFDKADSEAKVSRAEVRKLETQLRNLAGEKAELERGLEELAALSKQQSETFSSDIMETRDHVAVLSKRQMTLEQQLETDLARAREHRRKKLDQLYLQIGQTERQLAGLQATLNTPASFTGRIVYRAPSPQAVPPGSPLLVLAQEEGFRLRLRLARWQAQLLQSTGPVTLELMPRGSKDDQPDRYFVERRFAGRLAEWKDLPHDPTRVLVELACDLPSDAVEAMTGDEEVTAKLVWWTPILYHPAFLVGAVLVGLGGLGRLLAGCWAALRRASSARRAPAVNVRPAPLSLATEFGGEGAMLQMLGGQLREAVASGRLDAQLIAAAEWSLDRHRARAIRLMWMGLGDQQEIYDHIEAFADELILQPRVDAASLELLHRLLTVFRTLLAEPYRHKIGGLMHGVESAVRDCHQSGENGSVPPNHRGKTNGASLQTTDA